MRKYHKAQAPTTRNCENCGEEFTFFTALLRHGKACRWCSRSCFAASSRVTVVCDKCGIEFTRQKALAGRYNGKNYCSRTCNCLAKRIAPDRIPVKRLRYSSQEFRDARKQVLQRDGICQICENGLANSIHHKDWNPYNNQLDNLILLCKKCHGSFKRKEEWESGRERIMACSVLIGDYKNCSEMQQSS